MLNFNEKNFSENLQYADIVSFDIFDTLLVRPYKQPKDLFMHLEILHKHSGFCKERIFAETRARIKARQKEDITLDDIYDAIRDEYKYLKQAELELERSVLKPNPFIQRLYRKACKNNKKIIAISDMYLPKSFISQILKDNGYDEISEIFISSDINKNKNTKHIYEYVIQELNIVPEKFLHVGDNLTADFYRAKEAGMKAILIPKISQNIPKLWEKRLFAKQNDDLDTSILSSIFAYREEKRREEKRREEKRREVATGKI